MSGHNVEDELDFNSFLEEIEDLVDFSPENDTGLESVDFNNFTNVYPDNLDDLLGPSEQVFSTSKSDSVPNLSEELAVPEFEEDEWLNSLVYDSLSGGGMNLTVNKENVAPKVVAPCDNQFQNSAVVSAFKSQRSGLCMNMPLKEEGVMFKDSSMSFNEFQMASPVSVLESSNSNCSSSDSDGKTALLSQTRPGTQKARSKRPRPASFNPRPSGDIFVPVPVLSSESGIFPGSDYVRQGPKLGEEELASDEKKKKKMKKSAPSGTHTKKESSHGVRKCLHCEITETPQWRAGPLGPKTLCNACGVRYKSGRLFPEYRPAASPTFVPSLHSNSHRKVVEMRNKGITNMNRAENAWSKPSSSTSGSGSDGLIRCQG